MNAARYFNESGDEEDTVAADDHFACADLLAWVQRQRATQR